MKELKLEVGKRYVRRDGVVTGEIELNEVGNHYYSTHPFKCTTPNLATYKSNGGYHVDKSEDSYDLMSEYKEKQENMRKLKPKDAQRIIDVACSSWKPRLAALWADSIVMSLDISVSENNYKEMRVACTKEQNDLFDEIFGKDIEHKEGWYKFPPFKEYLAYRGGDKYYGFNTGGIWFDDEPNQRDSGIDTVGYTPATDEEVKAALLNEAEKRGFKKGVSYKAITEIIPRELASKAKHDPLFVGENNGSCCVYCGWQYVFLDGKWAEIISEPKVDWFTDVTIKEIAEWKGVPIKTIRIKE